MDIKYAPIVLFVYNRLAHTRRTIISLQQNISASEHELFIFSDGPKKGQEVAVSEVRKYIESVGGFKKVTIIKSKKNKGLAKSVIDGVTQIVDRYGKVIVLEDDIVCAPGFLNYMDEGLQCYEDCKKVYSISGYSFLEEKEKSDVSDTYLLSLISSWSWATWKDRWDYFDSKAKGYKKLCKDKELRKKFNYSDSYDWATMLVKQMKSRYTFFKPRRKKIDSWAIRWYWSVFKNNGLSVFPRDSLVVNVGMDGSGTHCGVFEKEPSDFSQKVFEHNNLIFEEKIQEKDMIREKIIRSLKARNEK